MGQNLTIAEADIIPQLMFSTTCRQGYRDKKSLTKEYPMEILLDEHWSQRICEEVSNFSSDGQENQGSEQENTDFGVCFNQME